MTDTITNPPGMRELRGANLCQLLHWLASGRISAEHLCGVYRDAIAATQPTLNAFQTIDPTAAAQARASDTRRRGGAIGRLDGIPVAIKDNIDVAGVPTTAGLPGSARQIAATRDAHIVERLRAAGAVILGKTRVDEGVLGASGENPHFGAVHNPQRRDYSAGGSSAGSAAAVAAGLCAVAIGSDSLGSVRIPASYCGVFALRPTPGEVSTRGMLPAARRLDSIGLLARSVDDLTVLLQVLSDHDAEDPRSRGRRVALSPPDWEPGNLRCGVLADLASFGVDAEVTDLFAAALNTLTQELGQRSNVDFSDYRFGATRRAGLLLVEAEMLHTYVDDLADLTRPLSPNLRSMLDYAKSRSAADLVAADRMMDQAVLKARRLFSDVDVFITPTTPQAAFALGTEAPANQADFTSFANLSGCPALSMPMGKLANGLPVGLQFVGPPGSDLRLLELAQVCAATLDAAPDYPVGAG
jgi:Asp-tRNA(Asn)/Glu-tRNA(Gln) amidotransferase A subunit family amidase